MNRRDILTGAGLLAFAAMGSSGTVMADNVHKHEHEQCPMQSFTYAQLAQSAANCVSQGQICLHHCMISFNEGSTKLAACAKSVNHMLVLCGAIQQLANQQSDQVPALAKIVMEACQACEKECRKHEAMHTTCKACADACAECSTECKKAISA